MSTHVSSDALRRLLDHRCHASRAYGWLLHLLHCDDCRRRLFALGPETGRRLLRRVTGTTDPARLPELQGDASRTRIVETLQERVLDEYGREITLPPVLGRLEGAPPRRRRLLVDNVDRLQTLEVVRHLLESGRGRWSDQPHEALDDCLLALRVHGHLSPREYHPRLLQDVEGLVWAMTGNVLRILGRLDAARDCFLRAAEALKKGTGDPAEAAQLHGFRSALERIRQRYRAATRHARRAQDLWAQLGEPEREAAARIQRYMAAAESGRPRVVARQLEGWLSRVDADTIGGRNWLCALQCHSTSLLRAGFALPALRTVPIVRQSLCEYGGQLDFLDLQLHEARLSQACGDYDRAEELLLDSRRQYETMDMALDVTFASLFLMRLYQRQQRRRAAREIAGTILPHLQRLGAPRFAHEARCLVASA